VKHGKGGGGGDDSQSELLRAPHQRRKTSEQECIPHVALRAFATEIGGCISSEGGGGGGGGGGELRRAG